MSISTDRARTLQVAAIAVGVACAAFGAVESTAGIQGSGLRMFAAIGPITALGSDSVSVGGAEYSTTGAQVQVNGDPGSLTQLHPGDVVWIRGTQRTGRAHAAGSVTFSSSVRGQLSGVDVPSGTIFVLGQTVRLTADTRLDADTRATGLQGLPRGARIDVSGFADAAGNIVATRVATAGNGDLARVGGTVRNLNPGQHTFNINALVVSYASARVTGTLTEGASVAVQGSQTVANDTLLANRIDIATPSKPAPGTEGRLQGLITVFASANYFEVEGQAVSVSEKTRLHLRVPLGLDVEVKVSGVFDRSGTLVAGTLHSRRLH